MVPASDVVVIGGGAVGSACARALALRGMSVTVLQRGESQGDGWRAAAGMLAAQIEARPGDPTFGLALSGRAFYGSNAGPLLESTGIDIGLNACGILELARSEADVVAAHAMIGWQRGQGQRADWLSAQDLRAGWPWLAASVGAFHAPDDGAIDPVRTVRALRADAVRLGAKFVFDTALRLEQTGERVTGVTGERGRYAALNVVIAAGAWSGLLSGLPVAVAVEPVRGQMAAYAWPRDAASTIAYGSGGYVLRRGDELLVGSTMERVGFASDVTREGIAQLQRQAAAIYPALADATPTRTWAGLRPCTPDGRPIMGSEPRLSGLWYATGHGRNGILLAGITGEMIAQSIAEQVQSEEHAPWRASRFDDR